METFQTDNADADNENHFPVTQQLFVAIGTLILVFGTTYISDIVSMFTPQNDTDPAAESINLISEVIEPVSSNPFESIDIVAKSAYVWDIRNQRALFNKNADEQLPLASITKLMTALLAYELMDPDSKIDITIDAVRQDGDSGFMDGETFVLRDITDLTLITSSNDGAYALAAAVGNLLSEENGADTFVDAMNIRAEEIGLSQTYFHNATGLDLSDTKGGAYGSARDVAFLMEYIVSNYPGVVELTKKDSVLISNTNGDQHATRNTNPIIGEIDGLIASKTGYTELAGGNLVIVFNAGLNRPIIISVLASTFSDRFYDVKTLTERTREYIALNN